jgi:DivIVA domain-containing protein
VASAGDNPGAAGPRRELQERIAQIRNASFENSRKGYDRAQVRHYLEAVADWLEGLGLGDADRGEMRRELAWVGERTSEILNQAEESATEIREQSEAEATRELSEAKADAKRMRTEAEEETGRMRSEAGAEAEETVAAANRRAEQIVEDASRRRQDIQALISDLLVRRDEIVADGVRLADELTDLFATAVPADPGGDEDGGEDAGDDEDGSGPRRRRFQQPDDADEGDLYDEDGVRVPLSADDQPGPFLGETVETDAVPEGTAEDPDTEEQSRTR